MPLSRSCFGNFSDLVQVIGNNFPKAKKEGKMGKFGLTKCRKWQGGVRTAFFSFLVKDHLGQLNRSINKGNVQGADV